MILPTAASRLVAAGAIAAVAFAGCRAADPAAREVTAYVSADRPFSEPIMREYEHRSGVRVSVVYDTEETKSTGLANRLLAEKNRPQADVFWSNEPVRTLVLKSRGVLAPYQSPSSQEIAAAFKDPDGYWTGFSARLRVIVYNTDKVQANDAPRSIFDLTDPRWKGQVALADPRFGSTSFHCGIVKARSARCTARLACRCSATSHGSSRSPPSRLRRRCAPCQSLTKKPPPSAAPAGCKR